MIRTTPDYQPVSCQLHSELELRIIQAQAVKLDWLDAAGKQYIETVIPVDTVTRQGQEFLAFRKPGSGQVNEIRLDQIQSVDEANQDGNVIGNQTKITP